MKVFVSWSGEASHDAAKALKEWLPIVIQEVDVFLSSEDIEKGVPWFQELGGILEESEFGVLCLTPDNRTAPWILYEAGAIAKRIGHARLTPLLLGLANEDLSGPLANFNAAGTQRDEVKKLFAAINAQLGNERLSDSKLEKAFATAWPNLEKALEQASARAAEPRKFAYDIFLSVPMAAFDTDEDYKRTRAEVMKVFDALKNGCGFTVYWAAETIESKAEFDALDVSVTDDLKALADSRCFVLIYPKKLVTSALFEAGYALALGRFSHYFVRDRLDLPFLMRELPGAVTNARVHTAADWKDYDDLAKKLKKHRAAWFPA